MKAPVFRRGVPGARVPGNQPYLWTPNLIEAVGNEQVAIYEVRPSAQGGTYLKLLDYEQVAMALSILTPGTFTYRYGDEPRKAPVGRGSAQELRTLATLLEGVLLRVDDPNFFELAVNCPPLTRDDLPHDFFGGDDPVRVFTPRQIHLVWVPNEPMATTRGVTADGDAEPLGQQGVPLPTPPRTFPLRWYRVNCSESIRDLPCRFQQHFHPPVNHPALPRLPFPPVCDLFTSIQFDANVEVTEYVWGMDQQFTTRRVEPARLVYVEGGDAPSALPVALGRHFRTPGLRFQVDTQTGSPIDSFLDRVVAETYSLVHQSLLLQTLHAFLQEYARNPLTAGAPWEEPTRPSKFTVRNLRSVLVFHLLDLWHTKGAAMGPLFTREDLAGCFRQGHSHFLDDQRFAYVCQCLANIQNAASPQDRAATLNGTYVNFQQACGRVDAFSTEFMKDTGRELLLNTLGIAILNAALQLSGAEDHDIGYFYKEHQDGMSAIFLFDHDEFGNGTVDVVRDNFFVSSIERVLHTRRQALGGNPDPLPTTDFVHCLLDQLQECESSQAAHLAFYNLPADGDLLQSLETLRSGERVAAGRVFDVMRQQFATASFDAVAFLQACPEFLVHVQLGTDPATFDLIHTGDLPTFQALESSMGFCACGCVACVVAPEQNIHGVLDARETVNKPLLDALYRTIVCEGHGANACGTYPGDGPSRTVAADQLAQVLATQLGQSFSNEEMLVALPENPSSPVTVIRAAVADGWERVFRVDWSLSPSPANRIRPRIGW